MNPTKDQPNESDSNCHPVTINTRTLQSPHLYTKQPLIQQPQPTVSQPTTGAPIINHTPYQVKQS